MIRSRSRHSRRTLPTQRSMCAFAFGALNRCPNDLYRRAAEDGVEGAAELCVTVVDQEPGPLAAIVEVHQEVAPLLHYPDAVGVARAGYVLDSSAADADEEEHVESAQQDGVNREE